MRPPPPLEVATTPGPDDGGVRLELRGELDLTSGATLRDVVRARRSSGRRVTIVLSQVDFLDCAGLRALVELQAESESDGGALAFDPDVSPMVARLLELTGRREALHWARD